MREKAESLRAQGFDEEADLLLRRARTLSADHSALFEVQIPCVPDGHADPEVNPPALPDVMPPQAKMNSCEKRPRGRPPKARQGDARTSSLPAGEND
jgi:hypothetical protein